MNRLFKFLGGSDNFFDEPPLVSIVKAFDGEKDVSDSQLHRNADSTLNSCAMQEENRGNLAGRKRPLPEGKESGGGSRAYSGVRGGVSVDADEGVREEAVCHDGMDGQDDSSIHPEVFCRRDNVSVVGSRGGRDTPQTRTRTNDAVDMQVPIRSGSHAQLPAKDCRVFTAPLFLTPQPVVDAIASRSAVPPSVDSAASAMAPFRASSPADSTPSNGSSSPALVVTSLTPRLSQKPGCGRAGVAGKRDAGGEFSGMFVGDGGGEDDDATLSEERHFSSSSQTQTSTSTRETTPSPSMQEGCSLAQWDRRGESDDGEAEERVHRHEAGQEGEKNGDLITRLSGCSAPGIVNTVVWTEQECIPSVADALAAGLTPSVESDPNPGVMGLLDRGLNKAPCTVLNTRVSTGFAHTAERAADRMHGPKNGVVDEAARPGMLREGEEYEEDINDSMETLADVVEVEGQALAPSLPPEVDRLPPVAHRDTKMDQDNTGRWREGEATTARGSDRTLDGDGEQQQRGVVALVTRPPPMVLSQCSAGADVAGGMETETDASGGSVAFEEPKNGGGVLTQEE